MLGFPWETKEDIEATIKFAQKLNPTYASFHIVNPYPKTEIESFGEKINKHLIRESCSLSFTTDELRGYVKKAFTQFYFGPKKIFKLLLSGNVRLLVWQVKLMIKYISR